MVPLSMSFHPILTHTFTWKTLLHVHQTVYVLPVNMISERGVGFDRWQTHMLLYIALVVFTENSYRPHVDLMLITPASPPLQHKRSCTTDCPHTHTHTHSWYCTLITFGIWLWHNVVKFPVSHCWSLSRWESMPFDFCKGTANQGSLSYKPSVNWMKFG